MATNYPPSLNPELLTGPACKGGRGLLSWGVRDLAREASVGVNTISRLEAGGQANAATRLAILNAFWRHGVEITNGEYTGARLRLDRTGDRP